MPFMSELIPSKLHVTFDPGLDQQPSLVSRLYTLTHSDFTGELFLMVGLTYDHGRRSNWYVRWMRDEVLGNWENPDQPELHIHCHVSGGFVFGWEKMRLAIFRHHLRIALEAICHGDRDFMNKNDLLNAPVIVHFHARQDKRDTVEERGKVRDYILA
jgi:hypothetical protein